MQGNFDQDPLFDGFTDGVLGDDFVPGEFVPEGARDSKQYPFTVAEATEMREEAAVIQAQDRFKRHGGAVLDFIPPDAA